jgi:hypothetical protein
LDVQKKLAAVKARLGEPRNVARRKGEFGFFCPGKPGSQGCSSVPQGKVRLWVNPARDEFNCWHCGFRGRSLGPLMVRNSPEQREYLGDFVPGSTKAPPAPPVNSLPPGFMPLDGRDHVAEAPYKAYLRSRGVPEASWRLYRMGYSMDRQFRDRVIIPSFDRHGSPNFWSARAIHKVDHQFRYVLPAGSKDVVSNEHLIDWTKTVYLVEGAFDEVALGPQAIALYGTVLLPKLAVRLVEMRPPMVHVCLDADAYDLAYYLLARLVRYDLPCSLVDLTDKDPSVMGRDAVLEAAGASQLVSGSIGLVSTRL